MWKKTWILFCLTSIALTVAFGQSGCGDDDGAPSVPLTEVESSYLELMCTKMMECPTDWMISQFDSVDECVTLMEEEGLDAEFAKMTAAVDAGDTQYDGEQAARCLDVMETLTCEAFHSMTTPPECEAVFVGLLEDGASCHVDTDCAGGWCDTRDSCPGVCATAVAEGDSCANGEKCEEGLICLDGQCSADVGPLQQGDECMGDEPRNCAYGLYCDFTAESCQPWKSVDESCEWDAQCGPDAMCADGTCTTVVLLDEQGADCDQEAGRMCDFFSGLVCTLDFNTESWQTCEPAAQQGDTCVNTDSGLFIPCDPLADLYCDFIAVDATNVCQPKKEGGAECADGQECLSGFCDGTTCAPVEEDEC
jgi:hypothetical protein